MIVDHVVSPCDQYCMVLLSHLAGKWTAQKQNQQTDKNIPEPVLWVFAAKYVRQIDGAAFMKLLFQAKLVSCWKRLHHKSLFSRKVIHMRIRGWMNHCWPSLNIRSLVLVLSLWFADKGEESYVRMNVFSYTLFNRETFPNHTIDIKWHKLTHWNHYQLGQLGQLAQPLWPAMFQAFAISWLEGRGGVTVVTVTSCGQRWLVKTHSSL